MCPLISFFTVLFTKQIPRPLFDVIGSDDQGYGKVVRRRAELG
jgi:hypothetical protein